MVNDAFGSRDVHRGREGIVRRLTPVHVIVGMDGVLGADLATGELDRAIRDDLVGVHVGLGAAAGLPDDERKVVVEPTIDDLLSGASQEVAGLPIENPETGVAPGGSQLEDPECADELSRHALVTDAEIGQRTGGLCPPITVDGHLDLTQAVVLDSGCHV
jgi:hypothetical protein